MSDEGRRGCSRDVPGWRRTIQQAGQQENQTRGQVLALRLDRNPSEWPGLKPSCSAHATDLGCTDLSSPIGGPVTQHAGINIPNCLLQVQLKYRPTLLWMQHRPVSLSAPGQVTIELFIDFYLSFPPCVDAQFLSLYTTTMLKILPSFLKPLKNIIISITLFLY